MIPYERRLQILDLLEKSEVVSLDEFCKSLGGVSESTVRRDTPPKDLQNSSISISEFGRK